MAVGDCVRGTGFYAIAAENAAGIVDVVDLGVTLTGGNAIGRSIFCGFYVDAIRGARCRTQETPYALFVAVFVTLENVNATIARLNARRNVGESFGCGLTEHGAKRHAEAFVERDEGFADFLEDG